MTSQGQHVLIAGGAGFLGSHLTDALLRRGEKVIVIDNMTSGTPGNLAHHKTNPNLEIITADITTDELPTTKIDTVYNLASPASPPLYQNNRLDTLRANSTGVHRLAELAAKNHARFIQASTSEVYGSPQEHPQQESYWGNVNPTGERSCYDEGKRYAEAFLTAARHETNLNTGIARIFNTYGPRMNPHDGRVVSTFIRQALNHEPLTIYGDGTQTRSFCYVTDMINGLTRLADSNEPGPINLGNPQETTILGIATEINNLTRNPAGITLKPLPQDDPPIRRPDITKAQTTLGWSPTIELTEGLKRYLAHHNG